MAYNCDVDPITTVRYPRPIKFHNTGWPYVKVYHGISFHEYRLSVSTQPHSASILTDLQDSSAERGVAPRSSSAIMEGKTAPELSITPWVMRYRVE